MLRAPNCDRAPKPRIEMRVSWDGLVRLATVTPGSSDERLLDERVRLTRRNTVGTQAGDGEYGRSSGERPTSRVTVTTGGELARQRILRPRRRGDEQSGGCVQRTSSKHGHGQWLRKAGSVNLPSGPHSLHDGVAAAGALRLANEQQQGDQT